MLLCQLSPPSPSLTPPPTRCVVAILILPLLSFPYVSLHAGATDKALPFHSSYTSSLTSASPIPSKILVLCPSVISHTCWCLSPVTDSEGTPECAMWFDQVTQLDLLNFRALIISCLVKEHTLTSKYIIFHLWPTIIILEPISAEGVSDKFVACGGNESYWPKSHRLLIHKRH